MRHIAKIAIGTALGIILAALLCFAAFLVLTGSAFQDGAKAGTPTATATQEAGSDASDSAPYLTDSDHARPTPSKKHGSASRSTAVAGMTACDANIRVKAATTSCAFAQNVFLAYWMDYDSPGVFGDGGGLPAYSPAVGKMFMVDCGGDPVVCKAGDGGYVTFPLSAVDAYSSADAKRYAASHETGGVSLDGGGSTAPNPADRPSDGCDPNYEGACLDPSSPDYDCEGGGGDGPDYVGRVDVVGDDPYELDRDGDGVACDV